MGTEANPLLDAELGGLGPPVLGGSNTTLNEPRVQRIDSVHLSAPEAARTTPTPEGGKRAGHETETVKFKLPAMHNYGAALRSHKEGIRERDNADTKNPARVSAYGDAARDQDSGLRVPSLRDTRRSHCGERCW